MDETAAGPGPFHRTLCTRQTMLDDSASEQWVAEADVVLYRPDVERLSIDHFPDAFRRRPESETSRWARLYQRFDLPELAGASRRFTEVTVSVAASVAGTGGPTRVLQAEPGRRDAPDPEHPAAALDPAVAAVAAQAGDAAPPRSRPEGAELNRRSVVTLWGEGGDRVRWRFRPAPGVELREGVACVSLLVEVPADVTELDLLVDCAAEVRREFAGETADSLPRLPSFEVFRVGLGAPL